MVVQTSALARRASDHLSVVADLDLRAATIASDDTNSGHDLWLEERGRPANFLSPKGFFRVRASRRPDDPVANSVPNTQPSSSETYL
jgi:hypothetical protein